MSENILRVAAYARVSTDKEDQVNSLLSQRSYFADYITHHEGWQLCEVYYDEGISGTQINKRSGFKQMVNDALDGDVDLILTKEVSRFARNTVDTLSYTRKLKAAGVGVIFTIDNIDTRDCDGELRLTIMASIAQEESRKTSERVKWGQKRQMEKGVVFGRDMLGYSVRNGKLHIIEEEAAIVRAIFHKYTNEGKGAWTIARELLAEGMRPKRMALWSNVVILRALKNEKYVGDLCQKKTYTPDYLTHEKKYNKGEEEIIYLKDHHEPIIDRDLWNRTQEELKKRSLMQKEHSSYSNRYWCSGKIHCGECGQRYVSRKKKLKDGKTYKAWRCYAAAEYGAKKQDADGNEIGCDNLSINELALEACMNYCIMPVQKERDSLKKEILKELSEIQQIGAQKMDLKKVQKRIDNFEMKKRKAIDLMLDGLITKEDLKIQTEWYTKELERLNKRLAEISQISESEANASQAKKLEQYVKALDDIMSIDGKSEEVYKQILDHMIIHKGNIVDIWLKNISCGIRLKVKTSGKGKYFKTEILGAEFVEN